jgi:ABC-2 type transport system permease protein
MGTVLLVARREFTERARERSFLVSTVVTIVILAAILGLPSLAGFGDEEPRVVALVGVGSEELAPHLQGVELGDEPVRVVALGDREAAELALDDEDVDAAVVDGAVILVRDEVDDDLGLVLQQASAAARAEAALAEAGLSPEEAQAVLAPAALPVEGVQPEAEQRQDERQALAFVGVLLLYGQLLGYGYWVAAGVVEEKASRIIEILLATIRPRQLLFGKVLGIGALALLQLLGVGVFAIVAGLAVDAIDVPADALGVAGIVLGWFVLGYAFFACAFAAAGALVPRQEELQNATTPLSLVLIATFLLSFTALNDPDAGIARVASLVPPFSAMMMPPRLAGGDVPWWELLLSIVLMLAAIALMIPLAARIYEGGILHLGQRVRVLDAWRGRRGAHGRAT